MPALDERVLRISGLRDLNRAFAAAEKMMGQEFRERLRDVAEPIRADAESRAASSIRNIGIPWSRMKIGVTRTSVYVAPRKRGPRGNTPSQRPNLADLLLGRAMTPALDAGIARVEHEMEELLADMGRTWEHAA